MSHRSINPATEEPLATYEPLTRKETLDRIGTAHAAYQQWRKVSFATRKGVLLKFAAVLRERAEELAGLITREMGKRISESRREVEYCAEIAEFYAEGAEEFLSDHEMEVADADAWLTYEPEGVLLGVMPWNFPFYQVVRFAAPNLMAGNTVLLRHASNVPQCAAMLETLFAQCGLPDGAYTNLFVPTDFMDTIIGHEHVRGVSLTGSAGAGASVASLAGKYLKRSVLELGGNDAFVVLDDADVTEVVRMAVKGRLVNTGQSCVASKRFIVVESLAQPFLEGLKEAFAGLKLGDPMDESTDVGPLSTEKAAVKLDEQVRASIQAGAQVVLGGKRPDRKGAYYFPTILSGVTKDMPTYDEELFGPVATVYVVKDEDEAVQLANDSSYGLGGSVYTRDPDRGRRVARRIEAGMVFINQPTRSQAELPFGGTKNSGYGRELSKLGIMEFVNKKLIHNMKPEGGGG